MSDNDKTPKSIDEVVRQVTDAVKPYVDMAMPYLEKAKEAAEPYVKEARDMAEPYVSKAREKAEPYVREAREKAEPVFDEMKSRASRVNEKTEVFLQFGDHELRVDDIVDKARADYIARGGEKRALKVLRVYLKPEDHTAYYVANNDETGKVSF